MQQENLNKINDVEQNAHGAKRIAHSVKRKEYERNFLDADFQDHQDIKNTHLH